MKEYILVGGIGSGKSTVATLFHERGAECVDLDDIGHEVLLLPEVIDMMVETFGKDILDDKGEIDRSALAAKAFASPADTIKLNAISQPRLLKIAQQRLEAFEAQGCPLAIVEISAYDGPDGTFAPFTRDALGVIAVTAPTRVRVERAVAKGFDAKDVKNRIARQVQDTQRALWADYVISNKGSLEDLAAQVDNVWEQIKA
jgi:dephospho-CoA kinase